jgi:hypothetical protein
MVVSVAVVLVILGGLVLVASSAREVSAAPWALERIEGSGQTLVLQLRMSGVASGCMGFDHVVVDETGDAITVTAYTWRKKLSLGEACTAELAYKQVSVNLKQALGDRDLRGCTAGLGADEPDTVCRDTNRARREVDWW